MTGLLTAEALPAYLREVGLTGDEEVEVVALAGGVSNTVLGVRCVAGAWVVKQSLPMLRVEAEWLATQERTLTEATALTLAREVTPHAVPGVVFVDPDRFVLVIEWVEGDYVPWKEILLEAEPRPVTGAALGTLLARWHTVFSTDAASLARVDAPEAFEQLRVDPFYRTVARRLPDTAEALDALIIAMGQRSVTFVHGDFSPKNILVEPDRPGEPVIIDFEVTHRGDPAFDVAFLLAHLLLKSLHRPEVKAELLFTARAFIETYEAGTANASWADTTGRRPHLHRHLGALLLSRTDGKSPADYLLAPEREAARAHGRRLLLEPGGTDPFDPPTPSTHRPRS